MNKISALEAYKISAVMEDVSYIYLLLFILLLLYQFVKKLSFLDLLKQNMGEEMTEQMSEEVTKAMDE